MLLASHGWVCCCDACEARTHDDELVHLKERVDAADVVALSEGMTEAEQALASGDAETAAFLCSVFQRGVFRHLGTSHRLRLRVLATARDAEGACGDDQSAAEAAEAWLEAARPISELIDPAAICHGLVAFANALNAIQTGERRHTRAEKARAAFQEAALLARITRGDTDDLVSKLAHAAAAMSGQLGAGTEVT